MVGRNERRSAGLEHWVDGTLGIDRHGGRTLAVAPNGPFLARHDLDAGGFISGLLDARQRIEGLPADVDHASGGPLHRDADSGLLLLTYHGETFRDADPTDYYSFIGLAASHDDGVTFRDLGRVVTSWLDEHDPGRPRPVDLGSGGHIEHDGWFTLHFQDRGILHSRRDLSVARARTADVVAAALDGGVPDFTKFFDGGWCEPGLGGRSDELLPGLRRRVLWSDAAVVERLGCHLLVVSQVAEVRGSVAYWQQSISLSADGIHWSDPVALTEPEPAEMLYITVDSGGPDQHRIEGDEFFLYRVRSTARWRWDDARLERLTVRLPAPPEPRGDQFQPDG
jgi:hypothetical protein